MAEVIAFPYERARPIPDRENAVPAIILILPVIRIERYHEGFSDDVQPVFIGMDLASGPDMSVWHFVPGF